MDRYFDRQIKLWGENTQNIVSTKTIAIIGCGGLGNSLAIALGSLGLKSIHLVDFDIVNIHNIHRQISFRLGDENRFKADVLKDFLVSRNSITKIYSHTIDFKEFSRLDYQYDLILDATDNLQSRVEINRFAKSRDMIWIYGSVEEWNGQVCIFDKSNFEDIFKINKAVPKGITAPMVMSIASIQATSAMRVLAELEIKRDRLQYIYYENGEFTLKSFNLPKDS